MAPLLREDRVTDRMRFATALVIAATALGLCGCAGGGSGSGSARPINNVPPVNTTPPPAPPPAAADSFRTAEYALMGGLEAVHAADAYARGYTGRGVIIGIVDFNFDFASDEVDYSPASLGPDAASQAIYAAQAGEPSEPDQHGHAVAATAAARKNGVGIHGVAYDATVLGVDYFSDVNETQITQGGVLYHVSDPFTYLTAHGARIVNTSYGYEAGSPGASTSVHEIYVSESPAVAVANGALLVASAGNAGASEPSLSNFDIVSDLRNWGILDAGPGAFIVAGAVDGNNQIAWFSNRAGTLADRYMVAPGVTLVLPWNGTLMLLSGTSFSAPMISGAAAILLQRWPMLTGKQLADILLTSATDLGDPGVDPVYGHGLLNIDAALQPIGTTSFALAGGAGASVASTGMILGTAFGDAPHFRAALTKTTILDSYGRDYALDLSGAALPRPGLPDVYGVMQQQLGWRFAGLPLGDDSRFDLDVRKNPTDGIAPFGPSGGLEANLAEHQTVARFAGAFDGGGWIAGTGVSLHDALRPAEANDPFTALALTQDITLAAGGAASSFAGLHWTFDTGANLSFGASHTDNQGLPAYLLPRAFHNTGDAMALRLDRRRQRSAFGLEIGAMMEDGGILGSLASGGLTMADRSATSWLSANYMLDLTDGWTLKSAFTLAATGTERPGASLVAAIGPVYATGFSFALGRSGVFVQDDALSFAVSQPLRAEDAPVALALGAGYDPATGRLAFVTANTSLVPSGREIDIESGYRFALGAWTGAVDVAYSADAGHMRGVDAVSGLFWVSRKF